MANQICTFCREKIKPRASVCRHCGRDLPAPPLPPIHCRSRSWMPVLAFTAAMVSGGVLLAIELMRERRNWLP